LANEILFILFSSIKLDFMQMNIKADAREEFDIFGKQRIRINIVPYASDTNTSPLVQTMDSTK
jgi:hypothetical protein